jgi:uncharacterized protein (DUF2384 family)
MKSPPGPNGSETAPEPRRSIAIRRNSRRPLPTPQESRRQSNVVQLAWRHFGEPGPVIAFLNTSHVALDAQPLHLAIESEEGFARVEALLEEMSVKRNAVKRG